MPISVQEKESKHVSYNKSLRVLIGIAFLFFLLSSCRKNKDANPPVIEITSPLRNSTHNASGNIRITATINDDKNLEYVKINLRSLADGSSAMTQLDYSPNAKTLSVDETVVLGDIHTLAGEYQIIVEAFDGKNTKKSYIEILVNEVPKVFKKLIVVRKAGTNLTAVDSLNGSVWNNFLIVNADHSTSSINNYHQILYVAGKNTGNVSTYSPVTFFPMWSIAPEISSGSGQAFYFNAFNSSQLYFWQSLAYPGYGKLKAYNNNGVALHNINMQMNHHASALCVTDNAFMVAEAPDLTGGTNFLSRYYTTGFGLAVSVPAPFYIKRIFPLSSTEFLVLGNNGSQGELRVFNTVTNGFWEQVSIPAGELFDAVALSNDDFVIAHSSGLLTYKYSTTNLVNLTTDAPCQVLNYDNFSGTLYGASANAVKVYHPITGALGATYTAADSVYSILLHYNK